MPLYEYRCQQCGNIFEVMQKFADEPLKVHVECGGEVERLISAPALQFKGSGWYITDYAKSGSTQPKSSGGKEPAGGDAGGKKADAAKTDSGKSSSSSSGDSGGGTSTKSSDSSSSSSGSSSTSSSSSSSGGGSKS